VSLLDYRLDSARELTVGETRSTKPDFVRFTADLQKITAAFRLSRKTSKTYFFGLKNSHLTKVTDYGKKHQPSLSMEKSWKMLFTATVN